MAVVVEGQTEAEFVKKILAHHLSGNGIMATEHTLGGGIDVHKIASEMLQYCRSYDVVTSLVDYYGFRGRKNASVEELERRIVLEIRSRAPGGVPCRMYPYVQLYEFESLLFSNVNAFAKLPEVTGRTIQRLRAVRNRFSTPENINCGENSAPSKRIKMLIPTYHKVVNGLSVAEHITLPKIREECKRFDAWIACLESLGGGTV